MVFPRPARAGGRRAALAVTGRGAFGRHLRRDAAGLPAPLTTGDADHVIADLLTVLHRTGLLTHADSPEGPDYRLNAGALRWHPGDGTHGAPDPLRKAFQGEETARVNPFFRDLYRDLAAGYTGMRAREHTAQVPQEDRLQREREFREGELPLLYCSPTMELGVDISDLNAVAMRNVPPTPANYAQRSGRAGRSGQQALVLTYCSTGNAHDAYWFRRSRDMVAGSVIAPRLDLTNEDLVRSHVHAIWLAESGESMRSSITDLLEAGGEDPSLRIRPQLWQAVTDRNLTRRAARDAERVLADLRRAWHADGVQPGWWYEGWVHDQLSHAAAAFDEAFGRWRTLYGMALAKYNEQHRLAASTSASRRDRMQAERRRADARNQLTLLRNDDTGGGATDFYSHRYLASEGFLPGYSFPRLPLAAYIPARRGARHDGDYLQRPRFVAISEFGPNALIYHEGARYEVTRVQLPRDPAETASSGAITETAHRCEGCGYHHAVAVGTDVCQYCGQRLGDPQRRLLRMQTVFSRRRERISSDEEERRKSGQERLRPGAVTEHRGAVRVLAQETYPLDTGNRLRIKPDLVFADGPQVVALADTKYKLLAQDGAFPNADAYQLIAYCTRLGLTTGHLIYAAGEPCPEPYLIHGAGVRLVIHAVDLQQAMPDLEQQVRQLSAVITTPASETQGTGREAAIEGRFWR